ncbi:MAG: GNAT family N-acetyltransferase [Spirosomataceae bacterium]
METYEFTKNDYTFSTNKDRLNVALIHDYLSNQSYWAKGIPLSAVKKSIDGSLCIGVYTKDSKQVGFARIITDYTTFGYLCDVFIIDEFRGKGLSKNLMEIIMDLPLLQGFRRWFLMTNDAHKLYEQFGFQALASPEKAMEIAKPDIYLQNN